MATKSNYTHYVVFSPIESAGIYTSWNRVEKIVKGVRDSEYLGLWSQKQAEIAVTKGYEEARRFKQRIIDRGEDRPALTISSDAHVMKW